MDTSSVDAVACMGHEMSGGGVSMRNLFVVRGMQNESVLLVTKERSVLFIKMLSGILIVLL